MNQRQQNSTPYPITFFMADSTDHITGKTGLSPTVTLSKNGGAFAAASGAMTEVGNGWYQLAGNATDRNTLGELLIHATAPGADPFDGRYVIVPWNPFDGAAMGLSNLDATISTRAPESGGNIETIMGKTNNLPSDPADASDIATAFAAVPSAVWGYGTRTLSSFGTLISDIWDNGTRSLTDKGGFLISGTKQTLDALNDITAASVWAVGSRTLTSFGTLISDVFAYAVEGSMTFVQSIRIRLAALALKSSGGGTATIKFKDLADSKDRITATVDEDGNRTAITLDGT